MTNGDATPDQGLGGVLAGLGPARKVQFYLTLVTGLALGILDIRLRDGLVGAAGLFLIAMAFVTVSHAGLSARTQELESRVRKLEQERRGE